MSITKKITSFTIAAIFATTVFTATNSAMASDAGAFIGGVFATKLVSNVKRNADAEEQQAAYQQNQAVQQSSTQKSPQARISELDKLAAGGYITPEEYKAKKQTILDSM